jgi:hypothetical protein
MKMKMLVVAAVAAMLSACTYYVPPPGYYPGAPANFDRSFGAASGAMRDQGLAITVEDRTAGTIVGSVGGGGTVTASVRTQADGSVRVQFDSQGVPDRTLIDRISRGYDVRMGR